MILRAVLRGGAFVVVGLVAFGAGVYADQALPDWIAVHVDLLTFLGGVCQCRLKFPQKCRSKIPHFVAGPV